MKRVDRDAMRRAIEEVRSWVGPDAEQLLQKLAAEPREDVGRFASYSAQDVHLQLRPWQTPPLGCVTTAMSRMRSACRTTTPGGGRPVRLSSGYSPPG